MKPHPTPQSPLAATATVPGSTALGQGAAPARPRTDAPTVIAHWLLAAALFVSLATGLRIASDAPGAGFVRLLSPYLPQGAVGAWHVVSSYALAALITGYALFLWRARLAARVSPRLAGLASPDRHTRLTHWNRLIYWAAFAGLALLAITGGLARYAPGTLPDARLMAAHQAAAWGLVAYVVAHLAGQWLQGGMAQMLKIVTPRPAHGIAAALAAGGALLALGIAYPLDRAATPDIEVVRSANLPILDGNPDDAAWQAIRPRVIHTSRGLGLDGGESAVRVRALHDGEHVAFLFEWQDPTRSQKHLPLQKTAHGWRVLESRYGINDENDYYEDKFAVMLSRGAAIGAGATQMGPRPIPGRPAPQHGRGLHATLDGGLVDVWHWKSVRVGPLAQMDDNHFGPPMAAPKDPKARYTGGYTQDPKTGGGFEQNFRKLPGGPYVEPKRLPIDPAAVQARLGGVNLDPQAADAGTWSMDLADTVPCSQALDTYPVGTILPSVLIDRPFTGDRGDVKAVATWKDGWWRLEAVRKRDTGSRFDLPIATGTHLWVAVFDHNQARHTRHPQPLRLVLE